MSGNQSSPRPVRVHARTRGTPAWATLAASLTSRDRWILRMLAEHRVLTTTHLTALAFPSPRAAQLRLRALGELGVIAGFRPLTTHGSTPTHWVLDTTGTTVLAAEDDINPPTGPENRRAQRLAIAHSNQLHHLLGVNTALTTLAATTTNPSPDNAIAPEPPDQGDPDGRLAVWWSGARCATVTGDHIRPDAYARWTPTAPPRRGTHRDSNRDGERGVGFWFEYDTGTERLTQLAGKLFGYHDLAAVTATVIPILFWLPSPTREANARATLTEVANVLPTPGLVPIATTNPAATSTGHVGTHRPNLAGHVWAPLGKAPHVVPGSTAATATARRVDIAELRNSWPPLADPYDAETTVLAAAHHPTNRPEPRRTTNGYRTVAPQPSTSWSAQLTPPEPTPPITASQRL